MQNLEELSGLGVSVCGGESCNGVGRSGANSELAERNGAVLGSGAAAMAVN